MKKRPGFFLQIFYKYNLKICLLLPCNENHYNSCKLILQEACKNITNVSEIVVRKTILGICIIQPEKFTE